ncbi:hypothetical protein ACWD6L_15630 [Micromonospora profundi]
MRMQSNSSFARGLPVAALSAKRNSFPLRKGAVVVLGEAVLALDAGVVDDPVDVPGRLHRRPDIGDDFLPGRRRP